MRHSWEQRIRRTDELLQQGSSSEVLKLYRDVLAAQQEIAAEISPIAGARRDQEGLVLEGLDLDVVLPWFPRLLDVLESCAPAKLAEEAKKFRVDTRERQRDTLLAVVAGNVAADASARPFFARMLLQPYIERLALESTRRGEHTGTSCPACGSKPQLAVLYQEGDGGKRYLACSLCFTEWEFRRVLCPACGETEYTKLPRYTSDEPLAVRVEACDTCKHYLKSFDLTVNGLMVAEADEIATVALDVWAVEQGYRKIRPNVMGF